MAELDANVTEIETEAGTETETEDTVDTEKDVNAEIAKLRAELAKQKAATDKATKEAADYKRTIRANQTAEQAAAEEAKEQQEALLKELETLRKERAVASTTAKVMPIVGDNAAAGQIAEYLYGAEDVDSAIAAIQKAWTAREKALRLEYGKISAPGVGASDGPAMTRAELDAMKYQDRVKYKQMHPDEYNKIMGR